MSTSNSSTKPGKDEADPLDFLSRHPLPMTGNDAVEKVIKHVVTTEHAIVMDNIREETLKDHQLQKLAARIDQTTEDSVNSIRDTVINGRDAEYKDKIKVNAQNKNTKEHNFITGDHVLQVVNSL